MNFSNKICLLCLENHDNLLAIFGKPGIDLNIGVILQQHFWFEVDTFTPKNICEVCWEKVQSFHIFYNFVKSIHQQQAEPRSEQTCETKTTTYDELVHSLKEESMDIKDFSDDFTDILDTADSPAPSDELEVGRTDAKGSATVAHTARKSKSMTLTSTDTTDSTTQRCDSLEVDSTGPKVLASIANGTRKSKFVKLTSNADANTPRSDELGVNSNTTGATEAPNKRKYIRKTSKSYSPHQHRTDVHTSLISQYFNMACDRCDTLLLSYHDTKTHYKDVHDAIGGYLICCNSKYFRLSHMLSHCEWHMNPDAFNCSQCSKNFIDKYKLNCHYKANHASEAEKKFSCSDCGKTFSKKSLLNAHQKKRHGPSLKCPICQKRFTDRITFRHHLRDFHTPEAVDRVKEKAWPFECDICGRRSATLSNLKVHILRTHIGPDHHHICEVCAKPFDSARNYKDHHIKAHTNTTEKAPEKVQCDICGKWLNDKRLLRVHILRHSSKPATCKICGRVYTTQKDLCAHIRGVHREASLECKICGKMFKKKKMLKEHMAIHYGIDLYSCLFCTKTFKSNANMYAHRKRAHPDELEKLKKNCETQTK